MITMSERLTITEQLARAGLDSEQCPLCGDGHLNFAKVQDCFVCSLCGEIFPTGEALRNWSKTNAEVRRVVEAWAEETFPEWELMDPDEEASDRDGFWLGGAYGGVN